MRLESASNPVYLPDTGQQSVLKLGIRPLDMKQWMLPDADLSTFIPHKQSLTHSLPDEVRFSSAESRLAEAEFSARLRSHLVTDYPRLYAEQGNSLVHVPTGSEWDSSPACLAEASKWVAEDFCLLQARTIDSSEYVLTAASVCSPSNWVLKNKQFKNVTEIHSPVPGYDKILDTRVNRMMAALKPDKPLFRFNWSLQRGNELFWREDLRSSSETEALHWRIERQTLVRLPLSGAIVFGIRIFLHPLDQVWRSGINKEAFQNMLQSLPAAQRQYKGLEHMPGWRS